MGRVVPVSSALDASLRKLSEYYRGHQSFNRRRACDQHPRSLREVAVGLNVLSSSVRCLFADEGLVFRHRLSHRLAVHDVSGLFGPKHCALNFAVLNRLLFPTPKPSTVKPFGRQKTFNSLQGTSPAWVVKRTKRIVPRRQLGGGWGLLGRAGDLSGTPCLSDCGSAANMSQGTHVSLLCLHAVSFPVMSVSFSHVSMYFPHVFSFQFSQF